MLIWFMVPFFPRIIALPYINIIDEKIYCIKTNTLSNSGSQISFPDPLSLSEGMKSRWAFSVNHSQLSNISFYFRVY